jgi:hypothetical protein
VGSGAYTRPLPENTFKTAGRSASFSHAAFTSSDCVQGYDTLSYVRSSWSQAIVFAESRGELGRQSDDMFQIKDDNSAISFYSTECSASVPWMNQEGLLWLTIPYLLTMRSLE